MMMGMPKAAGMLAVIPATLLLAVSFFVLAVLRKIEAQGLKAFGYVVAVLLWIAAALIFSSGLYMAATGRACPMMKMMEHDQVQTPMMPEMHRR